MNGVVLWNVSGWFVEVVDPTEVKPPRPTLGKGFLASTHHPAPHLNQALSTLLIRPFAATTIKPVFIFYSYLDNLILGVESFYIRQSTASSRAAFKSVLEDVSLH